MVASSIWMVKPPAIRRMAQPSLGFRGGTRQQRPEHLAQQDPHRSLLPPGVAPHAVRGIHSSAPGGAGSRVDA
jgi:hypothetical protein